MLSGRMMFRKATLLVAGILLVAASGLVWSQSRSPAPSPSAAETSSAMSPMNAMRGYVGSLPLQHWDMF